MYVCMASSEWSGGEPLASETTASKCLCQGKEQEDFVHRQARNVSGDKQGMFQHKDQLLSEWMERRLGSSLQPAAHSVHHLYIKST